MNKRRLGLCLILAGLVLVVAGVGWLGYNLWDSDRAGREAQQAREVILQYRQETLTSPDLKDEPLPRGEMPTLEIDGHNYIGTVTLPSLDLELPVMEDWSYANLKLAPCRYAGSIYSEDMVLCAHNYATHFGRLQNLRPGDPVVFTDMDGNVFSYTVALTDTLAPTAIEEMTAGQWPLTLFTCTLSGRTRVTVRCQWAE